MPPRGHPRKKNTRMDAALDAMRPMGFKTQMIQSTVRGLLKVYGGDDGWQFIEEGGYGLLLNVLLEKNDPKDAGDSQNLVAAESNGIVEPSHACADAEPSHACANVEPMDTALQVPLIEDEANMLPNEHALLTDWGEPTHACADVEPVDTALPVRLIEEEAKKYPSEHALLMDWGDGTKLHLSGSEEVNRYTSDRALPADAGDVTVLLPCGSGDGRGGNRTGIRKPCHGWIDDADDGDECLVELTPGPFRQDVELLLLGKIRQRGRRKRWDVKPPDM